MAAPCRPAAGLRSCFSSGQRRSFAEGVRFEIAAEFHSYEGDYELDAAGKPKAETSRPSLVRYADFSEPAKRQTRITLSYAAARRRAQDLARFVDDLVPYGNVHARGGVRDDRRPVVVWAGGRGLTYVDLHDGFVPHGIGQMSFNARFFVDAAIHFS